MRIVGVALVRGLTARITLRDASPGALLRWFYLNLRYAAALLLRRAFGMALRWAQRQAARPSPIKNADRKLVEVLLPSFQSILGLRKYDFAVEAVIADRFAGLPLLRIAELHYGTWRRFERHKALFKHRYRVLICVPWLRSGGADKVAANLAQAMCSQYGPKSVAIVVLDFTRDFVREHYPNDPAIRLWFPKGLSIIDLTDTNDIDRKRRVEILAKVFLAIAPEMIINVNSETAWECYLHYGKQLCPHIRLAACLFCNDYSPYGAPRGYASAYFRETLPVIDTILSDQQWFLDELALSRVNLDENGGGSQSLKRRPVAHG